MFFGAIFFNAVNKFLDLAKIKLFFGLVKLKPTISGISYTSHFYFYVLTYHYIVLYQSF